jgi:hypothetical protein
MSALYTLVGRSEFVPREGTTPPNPKWKQMDWARDVLAHNDPAKRAGTPAVEQCRQQLPTRAGMPAVEQCREQLPRSES